MYLVYLSFHALTLTCPLVLAAFFYNKMVRSDGRKLKRWELHLTVATGLFLSRTGVVIYPTVMVENYVMYRQGHSGSDP